MVLGVRWGGEGEALDPGGALLGEEEEEGGGRGGGRAPQLGVGVQRQVGGEGGPWPGAQSRHR